MMGVDDFYIDEDELYPVNEAGWEALMAAMRGYPGTHASLHVVIDYPYVFEDF